MSSKMRVGLLAVVGVLLGGLVCAPQASAEDGWVAAGSLGHRLGYPAVVVLADGRVLAAGGTDYDYGLGTTSARIYDPASGAWTSTDSMPHVHRHAAAALLSDGSVLVAGGWSQTASHQQEAEIFKPALGQWQAAQPMLHYRGQPSAVTLPDGRVFVVGDASALEGGYPAEIYDPSTQTWSLTSPPNAPRFQETATLLQDGRVLVSGGYGAVGAEVYDPSTDTWTPTGPLVWERCDHTATRLPDGRVLIVGGVLAYYSTPGASAEIYDPATNAWTPAGNLAIARYSHAAVALADGRVMVIGGNPGSPLNSVEILDPATGLASVGPPLLAARSAHRAVRLQTGEILVVGGNVAACERLADGLPDATPPTVSLAVPSDGAWLSGLVSVVADAQDDSGIARVDFYDGVALIGSISAPPYAVAWDTTKVAGGSHVLKARAFDIANNSSDSAVVQVTVYDVTPPQLAITAPAEGATVSGVVTITAAANDVSGIDRVAFSVDTYPIGSIAARPYSVAWDTSVVSPGTHVLSAVAFDQDGNASAASSVTVTVAATGARTAYDSQLRAPRCAAGVAVCDSGDLLVGRANVGPEPNQPNTVADGCSDGTSGSFHSDESLDRIAVSTLDGTPLAPGKTVKVEATVWAWSGYSADKLDLFYAADATAPQWAYIGRLSPQAAGQQTLSTTYVLPEGSLQAIRGRFSYNSASTVACVSGSYNDHDDLVFPTQQEPGEQAGYDASLRAPLCSNIGSSCSSGTLLVGRGALGPEPNAPNASYGECSDGQEGAFHFEESVDKVRVSTLDGAAMAPGQTVRVDATVWVGSASDVVDLFYSSASTWPSWTHIHRLAPAGIGSQVFSATYTLPQDRAHVVRAVVRFGSNSAPAAPCGLGAKDDTDDLWFASVAPSEGETQRLAIRTLPIENGSGTVIATVPGSSYTCSDPACDLQIPSGETVVLTAKPAAGSAFVRWLGECSGTGPCVVRMDQVRSVDAEFLGPRALSVTISSVDGGSGSVTPMPAPLGGSPTPCVNGGASATCVYLYAPGTTVSLVSHPQAGSSFLGWGSACVGTNACQVVLASDPVAVDAVYQGPMPLTITLTSQGGWGTVALNPPSADGGITSCELPTGVTEQTCVVRYAPGTAVSLSALPATGSAFAQWGGACTGNGLCQTSPGSSVSAAFAVGSGSPQAAYDAQLRAPKCAAGASACDSGTLLVGRGPLGPEPNYSNTVGATCSDGTGGTFHSDESVDRIKVATLDGSPLAPGKTVKVEVTIWAWSGYTSDAVEVYSAGDASAPQWNLVGAMTPTKAGQQVLSMQYMLPSGPQRVVRARIRYGGSPTSACVLGSYNDHDDLVF